MSGKVTLGNVSEMECHRLKALLAGTWAKCIRELILKDIAGYGAAVTCRMHIGCLSFPVCK